MSKRPLSSTSRSGLPRPVIADGTLEALKWLALLLMTGDHLNRYLLDGRQPLLFELGRIALPLFVAILAYNLARPGHLARGTYERAMKRLAVAGALASVPFVALGVGTGAGWLPLNVMFGLLALSATLYLLERDDVVAAGVVFLVGGGLVEYGWLGLGFGVAVWHYCRQPSLPAATVAVLACAGLWVINGNGWALAALPLLLAATRLELRLPRQRWAFYVYYPLHLGVIWLIRALQPSIF